MTAFFRVVPDEFNEWYVSIVHDEDAEEVDAREFTMGEVLPASVLGMKLSAVTERQGERIELTSSDFGVWIASSELSRKLIEIEGNKNLQTVPVTIDSESVPHCVLNLANNVDCFDYEKSTYTTWAEADGRADKVGQLRMVLDLVIDPARTAGRHIFRLSGWPVALIVSQRARDVIQKRVPNGIAFWPVTR